MDFPAAESADPTPLPRRLMLLAWVASRIVAAMHFSLRGPLKNDLLTVNSGQRFAKERRPGLEY